MNDFDIKQKKTDEKINAVILSDERFYSRMLELEFLDLGYGCRSFFINDAAVEKRIGLTSEILRYGNEVNCTHFILNIEGNDKFFFEFLKNTPVLNNHFVFILGGREIIERAKLKLPEGIFDNINFYEKPILIENFLNDIKTRKKNSAAEKKIISNNGFEINEIEKSVYRDGKKIKLTKKEYELFLYMTKKSGIPIRRDELFSHIWGNNFRGNSNIVDVYIQYLRAKIDRKLNIEAILTVRGVGYMMKK